MWQAPPDQCQTCADCDLIGPLGPFANLALNATPAHSRQILSNNLSSAADTSTTVSPAPILDLHLVWSIFSYTQSHLSSAQMTKQLVNGKKVNIQYFKEELHLSSLVKRNGFFCKSKFNP